MASLHRESTDSLIGFSFLLYPMVGKGLTRLFVSQAMRQKYRTSEERTMRTIRKNPSFYGNIITSQYRFILISHTCIVSLVNSQCVFYSYSKYESKRAGN